MLAITLTSFLAVAVTCTIPLLSTPSVVIDGGTSRINNARYGFDARGLASGTWRGSRRTEGIMAPNDFCPALQMNDRATLKVLIDPELAKLDVKGDEERNFQTFKQWLEKHECVESVDVEAGVLRSNPPIKLFNLTVRTAAKPEATERRGIGVRISPKRYEFDLK
jgi:hypothetical protein